MAELTTADLAAYYQLDVQTIQQKIRDGHFPNAYKIGKAYRVPESDRDALRPDQSAPLLAPRSKRSTAQQRKNR